MPREIDTMHLHFDNQAMIRICRTGKSPSMRYLARTHGVQVASMNERTTAHDCRIHYTETSEMAADIFTKFFPEVRESFGTMPGRTLTFLPLENSRIW